MTQLRIGISAEFPSEKLVTKRILGRHLGIERTGDLALRATEMTCRHQNADLAGGERCGDIVTCPRHGWRYNLATGDCLTEEWAYLRRFRIWEEEGEVFLDTTPIARDE